MTLKTAKSIIKLFTPIKYASGLFEYWYIWRTFYVQGSPVIQLVLKNKSRTAVKQILCSISIDEENLQEQALQAWEDCKEAVLLSSEDRRKKVKSDRTAALRDKRELFLFVEKQVKTIFSKVEWENDTSYFSEISPSQYNPYYGLFVLAVPIAEINIPTENLTVDRVLLSYDWVNEEFVLTRLEGMGEGAGRRIVRICSTPDPQQAIKELTGWASDAKKITFFLPVNAVAIAS